MLRNFIIIIVIAVVHARPLAILLTMITMRKSTHGFPFLSYMSMGLPLGCPLGHWSAAIIT